MSLRRGTKERSTAWFWEIDGPKLKVAEAAAAEQGATALCPMESPGPRCRTRCWLLEGIWLRRTSDARHGGGIPAAGHGAACGGYDLGLWNGQFDQTALERTQPRK